MNLVNFMDGIDWMTVAEVVPLTATVALLGLSGTIPSSSTILAFALLGATLGFAPFNKPVAKLFLGDVGSLPIGLLLGWLLLRLAGAGEIVAALLLPLYYVADASFTLVRRIAAGEPFWQAHRSHFYQRAGDLWRLAQPSWRGCSSALPAGGVESRCLAEMLYAASPPKSGTASRSTP